LGTRSTAKNKNLLFSEQLSLILDHPEMVRALVSKERWCHFIRGTSSFSSLNGVLSQ
jgi:hypothetical protein